MAVVPDIALLDTGEDPSSGIVMDSYLQVLYDYFNQGQTIGTTLSGASKVSPGSDPGSNFSGDDSPNFELVSNTNDPVNGWTIKPKSADYNYHMNFAKESSDEANVFMDPKEDITTATDSPPTVGSPGPPEASPEEAFYRFFSISPYNQFYVVEFPDSLYILHFPSGVQTAGVDALFHGGKTFTPALSTFGSGLHFGFSSNGPEGAFKNFNGRIQLDDTTWRYPTIAGWDNSWISTDIMPNLTGVVRTDSGGNVNNREVGPVRRAFIVNRLRQPGEILDGGDVGSGGGTTFLFLGNNHDQTYNQMIPWDRDVTPIFNQG